jgi:carboxyl-terminal processing protease
MVAIKHAMRNKLTKLTTKKPFRKSVAHLILAFFLGSFSVSQTLADTPPQQVSVAPSGTNVDKAVPLAQLQAFVAVYERIRQNHVTPKTDAQLLQLALEGLILKLDRFSSYLDAQDMAALQQDTKGEYPGIGIEIVPEGNFIRIITPIDNSPASRAGIKPGDWITHVQDETIKGLDVHDIVQLMAGDIGSSITLTILRNGETFSVTLTREIITTKSVRSELMSDNVGYLRISLFQDQTGEDLITQMQALKKAGADRWVLDLRNNPGGTLSAAAKVADAFLTKGVIVTTQARQIEDNLRFEASNADPSEGLPLMVLINNGSASASEIVAGAIKDHKRGQLMGDTSFGKGSVQSIISLPQGAGVKLTTAYYFTPAGHNIHLKGIEPDLSVSNTDTDAQDDLQLTTAIELLKSTVTKK